MARILATAILAIGLALAASGDAKPEAGGEALGEQGACRHDGHLGEAHALPGD
jgi:hypothetical protein